ncbi:DUF6174 domain-containing protein [Streptomyces sp. NPDC089424]|uniref:DUF6174 domain-containing protein n=1 Tax=Streptomyces sp. NPDC089424 TaxID=3365917 RepID=UPI00382AAB6A
MKSARVGDHALFAPRPIAGLVAGLLCATAACGGAQRATDWEEPSSYTYTLLSTEGERSLIGTFRVTVRDGEVATAVGLDDSGRRVVRQNPDAVPTLGELLREFDRARQDGADRAEIEYAADGHPRSIVLDRDERAIDDEAAYVISAYEPLAR